MPTIERDEKGRIVSTKKEGQETKEPKKKPRVRKEYNNRWGVPLDIEIK